jgi:hypothetical protein
MYEKNKSTGTNLTAGLIIFFVICLLLLAVSASSKTNVILLTHLF